jgi:exodeoxyribonuclease V alpha subunit
MDNLTGSVERITYYNPENGYSVLRLHPDQSKSPGVNREGFVTVIGNLPELSPGEHLQLKGRWSQHPKHGIQFQVEVCEQSLPATLTGIRRYLGSSLIKGIGPRLADRIVAEFGNQTLNIIEHTPERLLEVPDIGPKRSRIIAGAWEEQKQVKEIMLFLHTHGVSTNLAIKIYKQYEDQALHVVQSDPYRLAADIYGVGFKTADRIAQALGLPKEHPSRIETGVIYELNNLSENGHVFAPYRMLKERASELLSVPPELIDPALVRLSQDGRIQQEVLPFLSNSDEPISHPGPENTGIYLTRFYYAEIGVSERIRSLAYAMPSNLSDLPPSFITLDTTLSTEQHEAIKTALSNPVTVLTGGPGTGKTTCIKALIIALESGRKRYALASPTGRAAKRLSEATDRPASTIHRLLGYSPNEGFKHNAENPLPLDMLVVDEVSMLDIMLANNLLKAMRTGSHLLFVGDVDQLPSVGAGDVLRDIIDSQITPVTRLTEIFRQAADSQIITNAHRINVGQMPIFSKVDEGNGSQKGDFFLFPAEGADEAANWVIDIVANRIPGKFGFNPRDQIQVLAPMYRGPAGVNALNENLQKTINPPKPKKMEKILFGQTFRVGDKIMQIQNNYDKDVFNGDIGYLSEINPIQQSINVNYEGRQVTYDWSESDQLVLAYAVSVHKAQGSEFPVIVIPLLTTHYLMLQRNLLYTAITRARQLCVLVGNRRAIGISVSNNKVAHRFTALDWRLQKK